MYEYIIILLYTFSNIPSCESIYIIWSQKNRNNYTDITLEYSIHDTIEGEGEYSTLHIYTMILYSVRRTLSEYNIYV